LTPRELMGQAFDCFSRALCSSPRYSTEAAVSSSLEVETNKKKWVKCLTVLTDRLRRWWTEMDKSGFSLPSEDCVQNLNDSLVNASKSALLEVNSDVRGGVQVSLVEALEFITTDVSGPLCSVRIGADAAIGWLAKLMEVQRGHSAADYKYPRTTTKNRKHLL
jgi:hypothetical protein